ncbi:hypothetical protein Hypma_003599 [Hypsizygus marmoreus]|uniref:Peptidase S1 domain-containing protein n=1 Tax=Hypsizygus marmoreus TaxID=39966 RepID=A0A369J1S7_HYPMA|nr:hypothetical protein Hypma_003599 [Hypsizygus marmoreus]
MTSHALLLFNTMPVMYIIGDAADSTFEDVGCVGILTTGWGLSNQLRGSSSATERTRLHRYAALPTVRFVIITRPSP